MDDWADTETRIVFNTAFGPHGSPGTMGRQLRENIAEALRAAHKAGMEKAAVLVESFKAVRARDAIAVAIRKASETDNG